MKSTFKCKRCGQENEIEITEALAGQIRQQVVVEEKSKHEAELKAVEEKATRVASEKVTRELKDKENQISELKGRAEQAEEKELEVRKEKRELEESKRKFELEKQRQLDEERNKIRDSALKEAAESHQLKDKERETVIEDLKKSLAEAQRKAQQGSQQTQGEVLELEIEEILQREFPRDSISEVKKGQRGADIVQEVFDANGKNCGRILWESKNAKWSDGWIEKLKEDQRQAKAELAVIVSTNLPDRVETYIYEQGVWIAKRQMVKALAFALRYNLIRVNTEKMAQAGKAGKMEGLYQYITSAEFPHRIEAIVTSFGNMQSEIERERRWFQTKWARQEKQLRQLIDHTNGMYGDLQGVVESLPDIQPLQIEAGEEEN